jgi:hypothetical protein
MIPLFTARRLGPHYGIKVNPIKPQVTKEGVDVVITDVLLEVAENLVENTVHSAVAHAWKGSNTDAMATVPVPGGQVRAKVRVLTVINRKTGKVHHRRIYSWSRRYPNGMVTRPEIIARQEFIRRIAKALETEG